MTDLKFVGRSRQIDIQNALNDIRTVSKLLTCKVFYFSCAYNVQRKKHRNTLFLSYTGGYEIRFH